MSHHLIIARNVGFIYSDKTRALQDVSFEIHHGESVGIIGPNGAGKSTLINLLNGCQLATEGNILIGEVVMGGKTRKELRKHIGTVFQNPDDQLFMPRIYDDVEFGPRNLGLAGDILMHRVRETMETLNIWELKEKPPHLLSDGQKRAAAVATVMAMQPSVLVLDEPAANLDPGNRRKLIRFLSGFSHTKIIVSHDLDLIWEVCERTILLNGGQVIQDGKTEIILKNEVLLKECDLELPLRFQKS